MREKNSYSCRKEDTQKYMNYIHEYINNMVKKRFDDVEIDDISPTEKQEKQDKEIKIKPFKFE